MIVPDVNLLVYSVFDGFAQHDTARTWWDGVLTDGSPVGVPDVVLFGFVRVATNRRVITSPLAVGEPAARVEAWLARPGVRVLVSGVRHVATTLELLEMVGAGGNLTTDAQIAAHARLTQGTVYSNDTDFARFVGVSWRNPLA
ncbi:TA system VapC family ribonuclease toxin [Nocardioides sp.]|uniref:TA system VapC family ribonuclease toxin n=1 Tax=Nocardioides sp. TaxID=35761 RepID=UPI0039E6EDDC